MPVQVRGCIIDACIVVLYLLYLLVSKFDLTLHQEFENKKLYTLIFDMIDIIIIIVYRF